MYNEIVVLFCGVFQIASLQISRVVSLHGVGEHYSDLSKKMGKAMDIKLIRRRVKMLDAASTGLHPSTVVSQLAGRHLGFLSGILSPSRLVGTVEGIEGELQFGEGR
jgi:hypothetical protein